jgi:hypothetical protein
MASTELLEHYLTDHLAGATAGSDLAKKMASDNVGTPFGTFMDGLAADIAADKQTLEDLIERLGIRRSPVKETASSIAEKLSRLRFTPAVSRSSDLSRLLEAETLSLGIAGKRCLWQAMVDVAQGKPDPVFAAFDFAALLARAEDQLDRLEPHRRAAAVTALAGSPGADG